MDNKKIIAEYLKKGCKYRLTGQVGIEIEHFVTEKSTGRNIPYSGEKGVGALLEEIADNYDKKVYSEGFLIGLSNGRYHITIEPSSQLEISISPTSEISSAEKIYSEFTDVIKPVLDKYGYELVCEGCRRKDKASELELIPKKRYEFMDRYFEKTGTLGKNMMRATASVQVSVDYSDEQDCVKKFRLANVLAPLFALICDNTEYMDGEKYDGRMARTHIWANVDNDRCGIVPCAFDSDFGFYKYAEYIYSNPPVLVFDGGEARYTGTEKAENIYRYRTLSGSETEHLLSMFFPDVRIKQYIEIRPADSMPIEYALSYAALIKGIFETENVPMIGNIGVSDVNNAKDALIKYGFDAEVYGHNAGEICDMMIEYAQKNLKSSDKEYLEPIKNIIKCRKTLREMD